MATKTVRLIRVFEVDVPVGYGDTREAILQRGLDALGEFTHAATASQAALLPGLSPVEVTTATLRDASADLGEYLPDPTDQEA